MTLLQNSVRRSMVAAVSIVLTATVLPARAAEQSVNLASNGKYVTYRLPRNTREVELVTQRAGVCRFNRTWGYDLSNRELWVNSGCAGTFNVVSHEAPAAAAAAPQSSNTGAALAAAAALAGIAILGNRGRNDSDNSQPYYPPPNAPAYQPPSGGYYPSSTGSYPQGGGREGPLHGANGLCLDMRGDRVQQGTEAILYNCHGKNNQRFVWTPRGELTVGGMCLDVAGGRRNNGSRLIAWPCNGGGNQQWAVNGSSIRGNGSGKCLDGGGGQPQRGSAVAIWDCNGSSGQQWWW
ncbi:MAG: ricin-type beta-trefoil lectin domain protein [Burkholderiaceae bacterium]|nr:ricin-type beta-trefoil lectin domain protein [Burkholderiaceae bacterium]